MKYLMKGTPREVTLLKGVTNKSRWINLRVVQRENNDKKKTLDNELKSFNFFFLTEI